MRLSEELLSGWLGWYESLPDPKPPLAEGLAEQTEVYLTIRGYLGDTNDALKDQVVRAAFESVERAKAKVLKK